MNLKQFKGKNSKNKKHLVKCNMEQTEKYECENIQEQRLQESKEKIDLQNQITRS